MKNHTKDPLWITLSLVTCVLLSAPASLVASDEARVTRIIKDVKLLPSEAKPKPAVLNQKVSDGTGVRTGDQSRSELTFGDLTIERLGSNTVFSFNNGGRSVRLSSGSILLRVPKDSGGASMSTNAVTVGVTGTTVILDSRAGRNKLTVLEGGARVSLNKYKGESVYVRGGQMEDVPAGATKLPAPVNINLSDVMRKNPLITDFPALPSQDLIMATASNPPGSRGQSTDGEPTRPGPVFIQTPLLGIGLGPFLGGGSSHPNPNNHGQPKNPEKNPKNPNNPKGNPNIGNDNQPPPGHVNPAPHKNKKNKQNLGNG